MLLKIDSNFQSKSRPEALHHDDLCPAGCARLSMNTFLGHAFAQIIIDTLNPCILVIPLVYGNTYSSRPPICSAVAIRRISHAIVIPGTSQWGYACPQKAGSGSNSSTTTHGRSCSPPKHNTSGGPWLKCSSSSSRCFSTAAYSTSSGSAATLWLASFQTLVLPLAG